MTIEVGTCGYRYYDPGEGWKAEYESKLHAYSTEFELVELNTTFYDLPQVSTAERWNRETVEDFEFALKAWQAVTHSWASPTWNGQRDSVPEEYEDLVGDLRPNEATEWGWEETMDRASALDAGVCVVQTPPSFDYTEENEQNLREFFERVDTEGITVAWEPRGTWKANLDAVEDVCTDLGLVHVTDLLRRYPVSEHGTAYVRLHGLNEDPYDYAYDYTEAELDDLHDRLQTLDDDHETVYCLFNNDAMFENARSLQDRLGN